MKLGDYHGAEIQAVGALQIDPSNTAAWKLREQLLQLGGQQH